MSIFPTTLARQNMIHKLGYLSIVHVRWWECVFFAHDGHNYDMPSVKSPTQARELATKLNAMTPAQAMKELDKLSPYKHYPSGEYRD